MSMLEHAFAYAERGWPVFPCDPATKRPIIGAETGPDGSKIPGSGWLRKATTDQERIAAWWTKWPKAMIGIPCGRAIGAFVVDIDAGVDKNTGEVFEVGPLKAALEKKMGCALPQTLTVQTPRGGLHLYFQLPDDMKVGNRTALLGPGSRIDIRGEGGYVIGAHSVRDDGEVYRFLDRRDPVPAPAPLKKEIESSTSNTLATPTTVDEKMRRYALAALDGEVRRVEQAASGTRNDALNTAALRLGQMVAAGLMSEGTVRAALISAAEVCQLVANDGLGSVEATIESGLRKGKSQPRVLAGIGKVERRSPPVSGVRQPPAAITTAVGPSHSSSQVSVDEAKPDHASTAFLAMTDLGNAERLYARYKKRLRFCSSQGWVRWDDARWNEKDAVHFVKSAEKRTVRDIQSEAKAVCESGLQDQGGLDSVYERKRDNSIVLYSDKLAAWGRLSETKGRIDALSRLAEDNFLVRIEQLDADPFKINVRNGTLTVDRTCRDGDVISFGPHNPDDLITKVVPVDYDPDAICPVYDRFLSEIQPEATMRRFLHQWGGYSLTGDTSEQKLAFFYGKGGNGKSVLVDAWSYVAGDYGETVPIETFLDSKRPKSGGQATPELAILPGKRMLRTSEPERGSRLAEALIKLTTGGEQIQARHLNRDFFKFYPQFKLTMSGNYRPQIAGTDDGIWRRVRLVPFGVSIPKEQRDTTLPEKLRQEASGILNRLLDGLRDWCENGLIEPEEVIKATAQYKADSDPLGRWLSVCVAADADGRVQSSVAYALFHAWCTASGEKVWTHKGFTMAMKERGYETHLSSVVYWVNIKLIKGVNDFVDHEGKAITARDDARGDDDGEGGTDDAEF